MKTPRFSWFTTFALTLGPTVTLLAQGTAFTYHGRLNDNGGPASGSYDLTFSVFDAANIGSQVGNTRTNTAVGVTNGLFTAILNFGDGIFTGPERWLEIGVRTNGAGDFTGLSPRQLLTPTPYAIMANTASNLLGSLSASQLSGTLADNQLPPNIARVNADQTFTGVVAFNNATNSFTGDGNGLTRLDPSKLLPGTAPIDISGNAATATSAVTAGDAATANSFSGALAGDVTGPQGATVVAGLGGQSAAQIASGASRANEAAAVNTPNTIIRRDGSGNFTAGAIAAASVTGDGSGLTALNAGQLTTGTLDDRLLSANVALLTANQTFAGSNRFSGAMEMTNTANIFVGTFVGNVTGLTNTFGGLNNLVLGTFATISGGYANVASGPGSFVGGGGWDGQDQGANLAAGAAATVSGGMFNTNSGNYAAIGGGYYNTSSGQYATIGGGHWNFCDSESGTVSGGEANYSGFGGAIGGGQRNSTRAYATVGGGEFNDSLGVLATIAGGGHNVTSGEVATIGGGFANTSGGDGATIGGGYGNAISENGAYATIAGGSGNFVNDAYHGTIAGGEMNTLGFYPDPDRGNSAPHSAIGGGFRNVITGGSNATIGGGSANGIYGQAYFANGATISGGIGNVASGIAGTIGGGQSNRVGGFEGGVVGGGINNVNPARSGTIAGGANNTIKADTGDGLPNAYATIGGGGSNYIGLVHSSLGISTIAGGFNNRIGGDYVGATIGGGKDNVVGQEYGTIGGGSANVIESDHGTIPGGLQATAQSYGQMAYSSGQFATTGDAQTSTYVCRGTTTNNTLSELFLDGISQRMVVPANSTWGYEVTVTGRATAGNSAAYRIQGTIKNNVGTTTKVGTGVFTPIGSDDPNWDASVAADDVNDALIVRVKGAAATTIRWVASVRTVEVTY